MGDLKSFLIYHKSRDDYSVKVKLEDDVIYSGPASELPEDLEDLTVEVCYIDFINELLVIKCSY